MTKQFYIDDIQTIVDRLYGNADQPDDAVENLMEYIAQKTGISLNLSPCGSTFFLLDYGEDEDAARQAIDVAIEEYFDDLCQKENWQ